MKTETKHTPGPWRVYGKRSVNADTPKEGIVCRALTTIWGEAEAEANARLIAAAPDLLDAAKDVLYSLEYGDDQEAYRKAQTIKALRATIAAAPDLLYAAKDALDSFEYGDDQEAYRKAQAIKTLRAAIAKAEGVS